MGKLSLNYLIIVCARAEERCPKTFPGVGTTLSWIFEDPQCARRDRVEDEDLAGASRSRVGQAQGAKRARASRDSGAPGGQATWGDDARRWNRARGARPISPLLRRCVAELIGTFGLAVMAAIYSVGHLSDAHITPPSPWLSP
jgi:hypothetical protein